MNLRAIAATAIAAAFVLSSAANASTVTINNIKYDLDQFDGATVTYRPDGSVTFDGKAWDQAAGVDGFTLGELAAGQFGSDPGDQVSLNDRVNPDWLQLNYATPVTLTPSRRNLVIHEISSFDFVDPEGLSFKIRVNGGSLVDASVADAVNYFAGVGSDGPAERANQLTFDLFDLGFQAGDAISTVYIENVDSGSGTSDPDFIFAAIAIPEPTSVALLGLGGLALVVRRRRINT